MNTPAAPSIVLLHYKAWGDHELMGFLFEHQRNLTPEVLHKAVRPMNHIHVVDSIFVAHLRGQSHTHTSTNTPDTPRPEELSWRIQETNTQLQALAAGLSAEQAAQRIHFAFTDGDGGGMSATEMLMHVCVHSTYHRGQLGQMLKDAGLSPPRELLTRKLHTEEPGRRVGSV